MRSNMTGRKRVAASVAATALLAGGMAFAAPGVASASPVLGSADTATDFVNGLGLWDVAGNDAVKAPEAYVNPQDDGTVWVTLVNVNPAEDDGFACALAVVPALETPSDGVATGEVRANAEYAMVLEESGQLDGATPPLNPGIYAAVSHCSKYIDGVRVETARQPIFFATLGTLGEMS